MLIGRSRYYEEDPVHFWLERVVQYPYVLRCYLKVELTGGSLKEFYPNEGTDHWGQMPADTGLVTQDTVFPIKENESDSYPKVYTIVLNDKLIYTKASEIVGADKDLTVFAEIAEYNLESGKRSSVQQTGIMFYPGDGNLMGIR